MMSELSASDFASQLSSSQLETLSVLLDQYLMQVEQGVEPNLTQLCNEHPDLSKAIRHYVQSLKILRHAVGDADLFAAHDRTQIEAPIQQIGDYKIVREIGRGGMGVVYEALQVSLGRRVALKLLPFAAVLDQRQIARFQNEAQAAAQLHHPHIVPVYSIGSDRGTYFYSMQFIDGQSLEHVIAGLQSGCDSWTPPSPVTNSPAAVSCDRNGTTIDVDLDSFNVSIGDAPQSTESIKRMATHISARSRNHVRRIAELGIQAADAIHYAHEHGIVHRDIKPSNLLIDRGGKLWIADFGLAQCVGLGSLTRSGDVVGTLRYMSPEQAAGKTHWIDNRTDIYSLGLTLYELLTLRPAVDGNDRLCMLRQIEHEQPTAPRRHNPSIPVDLENIILKAISKDREDRYFTAGELARDLQRWLDGKSTLARRPSAVDRTARWVSKNARVVAVGFALLLILFTITAVTASMFRDKNSEVQNANRLAMKHLDDANEVVEHFGAQLLAKLEWLPGTEELQQEVAENAIHYWNAFAKYASHDPNQRIEVGRALLRLAKLYDMRGANKDAIETYRRSAEFFHATGAQAGDGIELIDEDFSWRNNLACVLMRVGRLDEAADSFRECLQLVDRSSYKDSSQEDKRSLRQALLHLNLGHLHRERGESRLASTEFERAWSTLRRVSGRESGGNIGLAVDLQQMLVTALLQVASDDVQDRDSTMGMLSMALSLAQANAKTNIDSIASQHEVCVCQLALGACLSSREEVNQAKVWFEQAASGLNRLAVRCPSNVRLRSDEASALNNIGQSELNLGNTLAATQAFASSRKILEVLVSSTTDYSIRSNLGGILNNQAIAEESQGNIEAAEKLLLKAVDNQRLALQVAPDCNRCKVFLTQHESHLLRVSSKLRSNPKESLPTNHQ